VARSAVTRSAVADAEADLRVGLLEQLRGRLVAELLVGEAARLTISASRSTGGPGCAPCALSAEVAARAKPSAFCIDAFATRSPMARVRAELTSSPWRSAAAEETRLMKPKSMGGLGRMG
jgi:hypothetical protein